LSLEKKQNTGEKKNCLLTAQGGMTYAKNTLDVANNMRVSVCARVNKSEQ